MCDENDRHMHVLSVNILSSNHQSIPHRAHNKPNYNLLLENCEINVQFQFDYHCNLRVAFAMAPINTGGIAIRIHPNAATYDKICARPAVLLDNTR